MPAGHLSRPRHRDDDHGSGRLRRLVAAALLAAALAVLIAAPASARAPQLDARAWALADSADGEVLAAHEASRAYSVASTTKLMTAYVARDALELDQQVVAPAYAPISSAESLLGLVEGERITTRDLLYGLILASGNDAANALAVASAGSVPAFVERMNRTGRRLGLTDTSYANPIGLDDPANYSSAADLLTLTTELREDRVFRRIFDTPSATLSSGARTRQIVNRNTLVRTVPYVNGVKTGYTLDAGNVLVASATRGGVTLVSAVLGAPTETARDAGSLELLRYGFSLYDERRPVTAGEELAEAALSDQDETLALVARDAVAVTARRDERVATVIEAPAEVEGPVARGDALGSATVTVDGEARGRTRLVAATAAPAASLGDRVDAALPGPAVLAWVLAGAAAVLLAAALLRRRARRS